MPDPQLATVDDVTLFVKLLHTTMPRPAYDALPDRQDVRGLPINGVVYRDSAHPGLTFRCRQGANWARYAYDTFQPELT